MSTAGAIRIGTSGFSYKEWLGGFYPARLAASAMLQYYAERLSTVEINYTFRAMPRPAMLEGWAARTPADFRFALKAPQRITHFSRLRAGSESTARFVEVASVIAARLAPALFQLPPDFKADVALLREFLAALGGKIPVAFEFRNASWFDDSVLQALADNGAALCIAETEKLSSPVERTTSYVYARLRREAYDDSAIETWAARIRNFSDDGADVFVYFKHEQSAPELAERLNRALGLRPRR